MLNLSQPLFDLPAWHEWQGSQRSADAGQAELEARRQDLIHRVAEAYLGVLDAQTNVELQQRELEAVQASRRQAEALHEAREIATSEYEQARARYDNVRAALIRAEGEVEVAVSDDGIGIPDEHINRLTERFYRVDKSRSRNRGGTGLGLSIVKHILGAHDRTLQVESTLGEGATFYFTMPVAEKEPVG